MKDLQIYHWIHHDHCQNLKRNYEDFQQGWDKNYVPWENECYRIQETHTL